VKCAFLKPMTSSDATSAEGAATEAKRSKSSVYVTKTMLSITHGSRKCELTVSRKSRMRSRDTLAIKTNV
jgi:hypothetical protein